MSRTTLCVATAAGLAALSVAVMIGRYRVLGDDVKLLIGPNTWKVTLLVQGKIAGGDARLTTAVPLEIGHQHIEKEDLRSQELAAKPPGAKHPQRHQVIWTQRPGIAHGPFRAVYQFYCVVNHQSATAAMTTWTRTLYAAPNPGARSATHLARGSAS
jgi:hypothetical protein